MKNIAETAIDDGHFTTLVKAVQAAGLVETSRGQLLVTNQQLFLNSVAKRKPVSIPLGKIASFHVYENGLEVWQDGKERPYLFTLDQSK